MFKAQVPFYFCSIAFCVGVPSAANPGQSTRESVKDAIYSTSKNNKRAAVSRKQALSMSLPAKQGMKFVSAYIRNNDDCLTSVKERSEGPFAIIDSVLNHYGLPLQLKYLAVIESELKPSAVSRVGAKGPWQLMPSTAHVLGLKVNRRSDERTNFYKSTRAAAEYLRDLHREFGDWLLVLAAYNGGPLPVYRAIHRSHSRNFWILQRYLPAESRQHVKKFIATAYYFEDAGNTTTTARPAQSRVITTARAAVPATGETDGTPAKPVVTHSAILQETDNERFARLMRESAESLKTSHDLLAEDD